MPFNHAATVDCLPPRWHASQWGTAKSSFDNVRSGYSSSAFLKSRLHTDDAIESRVPETFRRMTWNGTEKYWSSTCGVVVNSLRDVKTCTF